MLMCLLLSGCTWTFFISLPLLFIHLLTTPAFVCSSRAMQRNFYLQRASLAARMASVSSSCTNSLLSRVTRVEKVAEIAKKESPKLVQLSEEAQALSPHIRSITEPAKLNAQTPFFKCPPWAGLPTLACHLHCTRDGIMLPSLGLDRFPFYLFGRSSVCDYVLEHPSISSIHAVLVFHGDQQCFVLMDLGSTNGVKLNGVRIEKKRPVPAPVGSSIQFGFSIRVYKISLGAPSCLKRQREEQEEQTHARGHGEGAAISTTTTSTTTSAATGATISTSTNVKMTDSSTAQVDENMRQDQNTEATNVTHPGKEVTLDSAPPSPPPSRHLYHLLIKHKDVRRPVSLAPRNKGDKITRSRTDAIALAQAVLARHGGRFSWSLQEFHAMVREYSECSSAKRDGDLGMVENGSYTESFDASAFALDLGAVSEPVETELGVHLIYRAE